MTLEQLRVFVAVAERLHVTHAAAALNMTQSAASAAIAGLEGRLRTRLFNRVGRHIELTEAGLLFLPEARAVLGRAAQAEQVLSELADLERGRLSLWASQTIAGYWLPPFIVRFHAAHPKVAVTLTAGNTAEVARAVSAGGADVGFVEGAVDDPLLVRVKIGTDELVLVTAAAETELPTHMTPEDLLKLRWILREKGSGTRQIFEDAVRGHGIDSARLNVMLELPSNEAVRSAVAAGGGATVISRHVVASMLDSGTLRELPFHFPPRPLHALWHADRSRSRAEAALLELIRE